MHPVLFATNITSLCDYQHRVALRLPTLRRSATYDAASKCRRHVILVAAKWVDYDLKCQRHAMTSRCYGSWIFDDRLIFLSCCFISRFCCFFFLCTNVWLFHFPALIQSGKTPFCTFFLNYRLVVHFYKNRIGM